VQSPCASNPRRSRVFGYAAASLLSAVWLAVYGIVGTEATQRGPDLVRTCAAWCFGDGVAIPQARVGPDRDPPPAEGGEPTPVLSPEGTAYLAFSWRGARRADALRLVVSHRGQVVDALGGSFDLHGRPWGTGCWQMDAGGPWAPGQWDVQIWCGERSLKIVPFAVRAPAGAEQFRVVRVELSTAYDEKLRRPIGLTNSFEPTIPDIFVHFEWADASPGAQLQMQVWRGDRRLPEFDATAGLGENVRGSARSRLHHEGGWAPGEYQARFLANGETIGFARFVVAGGKPGTVAHFPPWVGRASRPPGRGNG